MHRDHICSIQIHLCYARSSYPERLASTMQGPFPTLTHLMLQKPSNDHPHSPLGPALPGGFLGGSAPCIPFHFALPGLPSSATGFVRLILRSMPRSGPRRWSLDQPPNPPSSCPDRTIRRLPPLIQVFHFVGVNDHWRISFPDRHSLCSTPSTPAPPQ